MNLRLVGIDFPRPFCPANSLPRGGMGFFGSSVLVSGKFSFGGCLLVRGWQFAGVKRSSSRRTGTISAASFLDSFAQGGRKCRVEY
jgi:hypothetical protein